jgi:hypothetical protein
MSTAQLTLLSTDHCTLCERALDLLFSMPELRGVTLAVIDVAEDPVLLQRYGAHLPVLRAEGRECPWPFSREDVLDLL